MRLSTRLLPISHVKIDIVQHFGCSSASNTIYCILVRLRKNLLWVLIGGGRSHRVYRSFSLPFRNSCFKLFQIGFSQRLKKGGTRIFVGGMLPTVSIRFEFHNFKAASLTGFNMLPDILPLHLGEIIVDIIEDHIVRRAITARFQALVEIIHTSEYLFQCFIIHWSVPY